MGDRRHPIANPVVVLREEFDDWAILFNPDTAEAVGINPVGVAVLKLMNGKRSLDDIVALAHDEFSDVPETAPGELSSFIADLTERGFVAHEPGDLQR